VNILATGTYNVFAKILTEGLTPLSLIFVSESLTIFFAFLFFGAVPAVRKVVHVKKSMILPLILVGIFNGIVGPFLWFFGLHYTTALNAMLFSTAEMVFLLLLGAFLMKEAFTRLHFLSTVIILMGVVTISLRGFSEGLQLQSGDILLLAAGFSFSCGSITFRKYLHHVDPQLVILARSAMPVMMFFFISPFIKVPFIEEISNIAPALIPVLLGFGLISRFLNTFTFYEALEHLPVSTVSLCSNLTMVVGIALAYFFLGEHIEHYHIFGGTLIVIGTLILELVGYHPTEEHLEVHLTEKKQSRG
jgi:drug/metabolite transporter (DMT)-like permease